MKSKHIYSNNIAPVAEMNSVIVYIKDRKRKGITVLCR